MRNGFILGAQPSSSPRRRSLSAHTSSWAWSQQKAEQILAWDATVKLQRSERVKLENELLASVRLYGGLRWPLRRRRRAGPPSACSLRGSAPRSRSSAAARRSMLPTAGAPAGQNGTPFQPLQLRGDLPGLGDPLGGARLFRGSGAADGDRRIASHPRSLEGSTRRPGRRQVGDALRAGAVARNEPSLCADGRACESWGSHLVPPSFQFRFAGRSCTTGGGHKVRGIVI